MNAWLLRAIVACVAVAAAATVDDRHCELFEDLHRSALAVMASVHDSHNPTLMDESKYNAYYGVLEIMRKAESVRAEAGCGRGGAAAPRRIGGGTVA